MHRTIQDTPAPTLGFGICVHMGDECRHSAITAIETDVPLELFLRRTTKNNC